MPITKSGTPADTVIGAGLKAISYQQITGLAAAKQIAVSDTAVIEAMIQAEGDVRWRADGTAPTATVGMILADGDTLHLTGLAAITAFSAIQVTSAKLNVTLWA